MRGFAALGRGVGLILLIAAGFPAAALAQYSVCQNEVFERYDDVTRSFYAHLDQKEAGRHYISYLRHVLLNTQVESFFASGEENPWPVDGTPEWIEQIERQESVWGDFYDDLIGILNDLMDRCELRTSGSRDRGLSREIIVKLERLAPHFDDAGRRLALMREATEAAQADFAHDEERLDEASVFADFAALRETILNRERDRLAAPLAGDPPDIEAILSGEADLPIAIADDADDEMLVLRAPGGAELSDLTPGQVFLIELHDPEEGVDRHAVSVSFDTELASIIQVSLTPSAETGAEIWRSGPLVLGTEEHFIHRAPFDQPEAEARPIMEAHYAGTWDAQYVPHEGEPVRGTIAIDAATGEVNFDLGEDFAGLHRTGAMWTDGPSGVDFADAPLPVIAAEIPEPEPIPVPEGASGLRLEAGEVFLVIPIPNADRAPPERYRLNLTRQGEDRITARWIRIDETIAPLGSEELGRMTLTREASIEAAAWVIPREEETRYRGLVGALEPEILTPRRQLAVIGRALPQSQADGIELVSEEEGIDYRFLRSLEADDWQLSAAGLRLDAGFNAILIEAEIENDVELGEKTFLLNGIEGQWVLDNPPVPARLGWIGEGGSIRAPPGSSGAPREIALSGESMRIALDLAAPVLAETIPLRLSRNGALIEGEAGALEDYTPPLTLISRRVEERAPYFIYMTEPIELVSRIGETGGSASLEVAGGDVLATVAARREQVETLPIEAHLTISDTGEPGRLWLDALERVARCHGDPVPIPDPDAYVRQASDTVSRFILTEAGSRRIEITKGDHAAALIMRDAVVEELNAIQPLYVRLGSSSLDDVRAFRRQAEQMNLAGEAFFQSTLIPPPETTGATGTIRLADTLNLAGRVGVAGADRGLWLGMTPMQGEAWATRQTRAAAQRFAAALGSAMGHAINVEACDAPGLIAAAGRRAPRASARVFPLLVKPGGAGERLVPDPTAHALVSGLPNLSDEVLALEAYDAIDNSYEAMAIALVSAGTTTALAARAGQLARAGMSAQATQWNLAAGAASFAGNAIDVIYGREGYERAYEASRVAENYALGGAAVFGPGFAAELNARAEEATTMAIAGIIAPALLGSVSDAVVTGRGLVALRQALTSEARVARGAQLAESGLTRQQFESLGDDQKLDLAAWYGHRRVEGEEAAWAMTAEEQAAFEALPDWAGATPAAVRQYLPEPLPVRWSDFGDRDRTVILSPAEAGGLIPAPPPAARTAILDMGDIEELADLTRAERVSLTPEEADTILLSRAEAAGLVPPAYLRAPTERFDMSEIERLGRDASGDTLTLGPEESATLILSRAEAVGLAPAPGVRSGTQLFDMGDIDRLAELAIDETMSLGPAETRTILLSRAEAAGLVPPAYLRSLDGEPSLTELRTLTGSDPEGTLSLTPEEAASIALSRARANGLISPSRAHASASGPYPLPNRAGEDLQGRTFTARVARLGPSGRLQPDPAGDEVVFELGEQVGAGSFNDVYRSAQAYFGRDAGDTLVRISRATNQVSEQAVASTGENLATTLDRIGRQALEEAPGDIVRSPGVLGRFQLSDSAGYVRVVEVVENVGESASRTLRRQNGRLTPDQAIAYDRAVRALNEKGYVVVDGHAGNFSFVTRPDSGELQVAIFDPGGILPVRNQDPETARRVQALINNPGADLIRRTDAGQNALVRLTWQMRDLMPELERHVDFAAFGLAPDDLVFNANIGLRHPELGVLFSASDAEAAYDALRAADAVTPPG